MSEHRVAMRQVARINQSPLNQKQWCLTLSCGHELWVTRRTRPKIKFAACSKCAEGRVWKEEEE